MMELSKIFWTAFATGMGLTHGIAFGLIVVIAFMSVIAGLFNAHSKMPPRK